MTTIPSTVIVAPDEPLFNDDEATALAGFLAGYNGLTRDAYTLDLRMFTAWCQQHELQLFQARRPDIECFSRDMEARRSSKPSTCGPRFAAQDRPPLWHPARQL